MTPERKIVSANKTRELILEILNKQIPLEDLKTGYLYECWINRSGACCAIYTGKGRFAYADEDKYMGDGGYQLRSANYQDFKPDNVSGLVSPLREIEKFTGDAKILAEYANDARMHNEIVLEYLKRWEYSKKDEGDDDVHKWSAEVGRRAWRSFLKDK